MLRTCIGADGSTARDYPTFAENKIRFENGNGDLVNHHRPGSHRHHGGEPGGSNHWSEGHNGHTDLKEALTDLLPEEIPGLPRHRPGEFSPRWTWFQCLDPLCSEAIWRNGCKLLCRAEQRKWFNPPEGPLLKIGSDFCYTTFHLERASEERQQHVSN